MPKKQGEKKDTALPATDMSLNGLGDRLIYKSVEKVSLFWGSGVTVGLLLIGLCERVFPAFINFDYFLIIKI